MPALAQGSNGTPSEGDASSMEFTPNAVACMLTKDVVAFDTVQMDGFASALSHEDTTLPYNSSGNRQKCRDMHTLGKIPSESEQPVEVSKPPLKGSKQPLKVSKPPIKESKQQLVHNIDTGENFSSIQAAIDDPDTADNHTITVDPGTYTENVHVTKSLTIRSENGPAKCTVQRFNWFDVDYVNIEGFTVIGADVGIRIDGSKHCDVSNNIVSKCGWGIYVDSGSEDSEYNILSNNTVTNCDEGICVRYGGKYNTITKNHISDNGEGIYFDFMDCNGHSKITDNVVSNNLYVGLLLYDCPCCNTIKNNFITDNGRGLSMGDYYVGGNNTIYNNYFDNANNADDDGTNIWNISEEDGPNIIGGDYLGGNYWSDYTGIDEDGDGHGDTMLPYNSSGGIQNGGDLRPLVTACFTPPEITSSAPLSPVNDTICTWRTFNVTIDQTVNVRWYLKDMLLFTNLSVRKADCTLHAEVVGEHNVTANASNANGSDLQTWIWNVTGFTAEPPEITYYAPKSPVNDTRNATRTFNITINQSVDVSWQINGTTVQTNEGLTEASYTNTRAVIGTWNVSVIVSNENGTDMQTWIWTVTSPCFIATAAYGTPLHDDIDVLRDFRDEYLMSNPTGRTFVKVYYTLSPPIANLIRENEGLGTAVREGFVKPLVYVTRGFVG